ncbi:hypothetical protein EVAR_69555_1 [Eumeta japonica]|uniref:Uncharacterized protein n=1 Tax=Eumeta variegata TaxID=151549 RepID=A0A4C2A1W6_EUMVA|nr:hypothetical protein EVAR_69555_1 [Eumeta japonica]
MATVFQGLPNEDFREFYNNYETLAALKNRSESQKKAGLSLASLQITRRIKSAITNSKQVYEENRETVYDLLMEWGPKKIPRSPYKQRDDRHKATTAGQDGSSTLLVSQPRRWAMLRDTDEKKFAPS